MALQLVVEPSPGVTVALHLGYPRQIAQVVEQSIDPAPGVCQNSRDCLGSIPVYSSGYRCPGAKLGQWYEFGHYFCSA